MATSLPQPFPDVSMIKQQSNSTCSLAKACYDVVHAVGHLLTKHVTVKS
jgi:hypothetical protein